MDRRNGRRIGPRSPLDRSYAEQAVLNEPNFGTMLHHFGIDFDQFLDHVGQNFETDQA